MRRIALLKFHPKTMADQARICSWPFGTLFIVFLLLFGGQAWGQSRKAGLWPDTGQEQPIKRKVHSPDLERPITNLREAPALEKREEPFREAGDMNPIKAQKNFHSIPKPTGVKPHVVKQGGNKNNFGVPLAGLEEGRESFRPPIVMYPVERNFQLQEEANLMPKGEEYSFDQEEDNFYSQGKKLQEQNNLKGRFFEEPTSSGDEKPSNTSKKHLLKN
jgi:hypothetical protein